MLVLVSYILCVKRNINNDELWIASCYSLLATIGLKDENNLEFFEKSFFVA